MPTEISLQAKLKSNDAYSYADANYHCGLSLTEVYNNEGNSFLTEWDTPISPVVVSEVLVNFTQ